MTINHLLPFFIVALYVRDDWKDARWLPWWRRYAPSIFLFGWATLRLTKHTTVADVAYSLWAVAFLANWYTAHKNRDNGNDRKKAESAEAARLTEVQQASFRREATEAA